MDFGRRKEWLLSELSRYEDDYPSWTTMPGHLDPFQHNHPFDFRSRDGNSFAWGLTSEDHFPPGVEPKMHHNDLNFHFDEPEPWDIMTGKMQRWGEIDVPTGGGQTFVGFQIESLSNGTWNGDGYVEIRTRDRLKIHFETRYGRGCDWRVRLFWVEKYWWGVF